MVSSASAKARKYYNKWVKYELELKRWGYTIPSLLANRLLPLLTTGKENVVDVGCGTGLVGRELQLLGWRGNLVGVDIAEKRLVEATKKLAYRHYVQADAELLPFKDEAFEIVASAGMVGLSGITSVNEMLRILKPGGYLACIACEIKNSPGSPALFKKIVKQLNNLYNTQIIHRESIGRGYTKRKDKEYYVYYILKKGGSRRARVTK